jgi:hypothetical protein
MALAKKNTLSKDTAAVTITRTHVPAQETLFPEKLKKANDVLSKTQFITKGPKSA